MFAATSQTVPPYEPLMLLSGIPYGMADGMPLLLDMVCPHGPPTAPRPAVVWLFGGGWFSGARTEGLVHWCCPLLAAHGFVTASIEYRLSYQAVFPAQIHDVKAAIRWLRANAAAYHIDPDRIGVWGFSAGGHLAALAGLTGDRPDLEGPCGSAGYSSRVQAVAVGSTPSDFLQPGAWSPQVQTVIAQLFGGTVAEREDLMRLASPITHVSAAAPPFLIAHATLDETVPFAQAKRLATALMAAGSDVEFIVREGAYHNWSTIAKDGPFTESTAPYGELGRLALPFFQKHLCA